MSNSSSSGDDDDAIIITLKYNQIQKKIKFDCDYDDLLKKAIKNFGIDKKKNDIIFYYMDEDYKKYEICKDITPSDFQTIYQEHDNNLLLYINLKPKNEVINLETMKVEEVTVKKEDSQSDFELIKSKASLENSDYNENEDRKELYQSEGNKQTSNITKSKYSFDSNQEMGDDIYKSSVSKDIEKMQNKYKTNIQEIKEYKSKNEILEQKIKEINALIEQAKNESNDFNNDDSGLTKSDFEKKKQEILEDTKNMENEKTKEIEKVKNKVNEIVKSIKEISSTLFKQREENKKMEESNNSSFTLSLTINESNKKEKKMNKIKKINELNKKLKESQLKKQLDKKDNIYIQEEENKEKEIRKSLTFPKKENKRQNDIIKENNELKSDIKDMENQIDKTENEIEDMKKIFEDEIKKLQEIEV